MRGIFRRRWTKVCGAIEKTAAELGLDTCDEEHLANALSMTPPKSAGRRGSRSPSPPETPPRSTRVRSPPKTPPASTSTAPTPPRSASFSSPPTGTGQKSTKVPLIGYIKMEADINNNNAGVVAKNEEPPDVSQFCQPKTLFRRFLANFGNDVLLNVGLTIIFLI